MVEVRLAPREIKDLIYRSSRVAGCEAGLAQRLAANVLHAEVHRGQGIEAFLSAPAEGREGVGALAVAADLIEEAEVNARRNAAATALFSPAAPMAALSQTLWDAAIRGAVPAPEFLQFAATETIVAVDLRRGELDAGVLRSSEERQAQAFRDGVLVSNVLVQGLEEAAGRFLVAEATLDALEE